MDIPASLPVPQEHDAVVVVVSPEVVAVEEFVPLVDDVAVVDELCFPQLAIRVAKMIVRKNFGVRFFIFFTYLSSLCIT